MLLRCHLAAYLEHGKFFSAKCYLKLMLCYFIVSSGRIKIHYNDMSLIFDNRLSRLIVICYIIHPSRLKSSAFSALTLLVRHQEVKIERRGVGVVIYLERGADCLHVVHLMLLHPYTPSSLGSLKSRLVLPFGFWLT